MKYGAAGMAVRVGEEHWMDRHLIVSMLQTGCAAWADGTTFLGLLTNKIGLLQLCSFFSLREMGGGNYGNLRERSWGARKGKGEDPHPNSRKTRLCNSAAP